MNYYIQGDATKVEEIKAAFEKKGYDISWPEGCANPAVINIGVERNGAKYVVAETSEYIKDIIKTHPDYQELELPVEPKFKVGDWLYHNTCGIHPILVKDYSKRRGYKVECISSTYCLQESVVEREYHLWSIADAKDGDVLATNNIICIFKKLDKDGYYIISPCVYTVKGGLEVIDDENDSIGSCGFKPATKEDRELLFRKMNEAGYKWDEEKRELRKIKAHYDIANFNPFDKVLVRVGNNNKWTCDLFSHYYKGFHCIGCNDWSQCIPYNDDTKHLLGTTDMCDEQYINW